MLASDIPKQQSKERHTDNRPYNKPGIYVHKDTKAKFITAPGEDGIVQADALMNPTWQDAWEWVAEVPSREELLAMRKAQEKEDGVLIEAAKIGPDGKPLKEKE